VINEAAPSSVASLVPADDFVVVCRTGQEAQTALALAESFLRDELGVSLHPEKTRIVHVDHGFEFLGYKGAA
jgi:acetylornithine/succinyldiaminopimelate/putrescine aminotransferase